MNPHGRPRPQMPALKAAAKPAVRRYIANQEEHHRVRSFREELLEMLNKAGVDFDSKHLN